MTARSWLLPRWKDWPWAAGRAIQEGLPRCNPIFVLGAHADVAEAVELLVQHRIGGLPVVDDGSLVGVFTEADALRAYLELLKATEPAEPR